MKTSVGLAAGFATIALFTAGDGAKALSSTSPPAIILGGEIFNSSASSPAYTVALWPRLQALNLNTVLAPATWDQIEPIEGRFDFEAIDAVLAQARRADLHIGLLWFGAFKNGRSTYAPTWVRANPRRFPRARTEKPLKATGATVTSPPPILSVFSRALVEADGKAFAALLAHLQTADPDGRVVLVQVENEVGLLGDSRDRSSIAQTAWSKPVPSALITRLSGETGSSFALAAAWTAHGRHMSGSWSEVFGEGPLTDEAFMAWSFASYVERVARAGRPLSNAPLYTNGWLGPQPGETEPGEYPSGGPTARMLDVWKVAAPSLAFLSPDVYVDDAKSAQAGYDRPDNRLFMPEVALRNGDVFWALGQHKALGAAVFGIDKVRAGSQLAQAFGLLGPMTDIIAKAQSDGRIAGVLLCEDEVQTVQLGGVRFAVRDEKAFWRRRALDAGAQPEPPPPPAASETEERDIQPDRRAFGLIISEGGGVFLFAGQGFIVDATHNDRPLEYDQVEEGVFKDGRWVSGRRLNGDEYARVVPSDHIGMTRATFLAP